MFAFVLRSSQGPRGVDLGVALDWSVLISFLLSLASLPRDEWRAKQTTRQGWSDFDLTGDHYLL